MCVYSVECLFPPRVVETVIDTVGKTVIFPKLIFQHDYRFNRGALGSGERLPAFNIMQKLINILQWSRGKR